MHSVAGRGVRRLKFKNGIKWHAVAHTTKADTSWRSRTQPCPYGGLLTIFVDGREIVLHYSDLAAVISLRMSGCSTAGSSMRPQASHMPMRESHFSNSGAALTPKTERK